MYIPVIVIVILLVQIYWNVPSYNCRKMFDPSDHGINTNANHEFQGNKIVIFYEKDLGYYPYCEDQDENGTKCTKPKYGGVPQVNVFYKN